MIGSTWFGVLAASNYAVGNVWIAAACNVLQAVCLIRWALKSK